MQKTLITITYNSWETEELKEDCWEINMTLLNIKRIVAEVVDTKIISNNKKWK